ncbi:MAG: hypothetical protein HRU27_05610 [Rhizobiaceae bacterium]|nr:hypothetical protein [Hyphomicrobiales bacterium]NRB30054.1 hypothetical protein [Rhizobiaceae bacterium]
MTKPGRLPSELLNVFPKLRHLPTMGGLSLALISPAWGHEFGVGKDAYADFLSGNEAVLTDVPVLLGIIAAGLLAGIWKLEGFPTLWLSFVIGIIAGAALGFSGWVPPTWPAFLAVIAIGALGAWALPFSTAVMRALFFAIGVLMTNAVLSGHTVSEVPPFAYVGILFALNIGVSACARLVFLSHQYFPYGWVSIVWRAGSSWLVAIAVMALALMLRQ